jgi:hypothetical protein
VRGRGEGGCDERKEGDGSPKNRPGLGLHGWTSSGDNKDFSQAFRDTVLSGCQRENLAGILCTSVVLSIKKFINGLHRQTGDNPDVSIAFQNRLE